MMEEMTTKKKGTISGDNIFALHQRYGLAAIFTLLKEVGQHADSKKLDWKTIVERSSTGISNPREYQFLWRHLAYCEPLLENKDETEPADDDSDLEFELEPVPTARSEDILQAKEGVKVLMSSTLPSVSGLPNNSTVKVCRASAISNTNALSKEQVARPAYGKNTTTFSPTKGIDGNETTGAVSANKRSECKKRNWTDEEDEVLITAVQKHGERNWGNIRKEYFNSDRTAVQLSQRWSILKKRDCNSIRSAQADALKAARDAFNSAIGMPRARGLSAINSGTIQPLRPWTPQPSNLPQEPKTLQQEAPNKPQPQAKPKSPPPSNTKPSITTNSLIKAAAMAAGGRVVAPAAAASLLQAAQSRNVVHFRASGSNFPSSLKRGRASLSSRNPRPFPMPLTVPNHKEKDDGAAEAK